MRRPVIAVLTSAAMLAGCATTVDGAAVNPEPSAAPTVPRALDQVLPTTQELSTALGIAPDGFMGQLVEGGADTLLQGIDRSEATPVDCVSATYRLQQVAYEASPVRLVASRSWAGGNAAGPSMSAFFGVVQFATADDAQAFFAASAEKWRHCDGQTLVLHQAENGTSEQSRITDVVVDSRVVSAVVMHDAGQADSLTLQRALGVAADCIVDVELTDLDDARLDGAQGAVDVAGLMLDKIA